MNKKNILFLAAQSGDGQFRRLLDPKLKKAFSASDLYCCEAFVPDLDLSTLKLFDVIVIMRSPLPGHSKDDSAAWRKLFPHLVNFVENGGSMVLMFAESYGKSVGTLNELGELFDIRFLFNQLVETDVERNQKLLNMSEGKLITCDFTGQCPFDCKSEAIDLLVEGGHGTQHLTCLTGKDWVPLIRGSKTCTSNPFPHGHYAHSGTEIITAPELAAWRKFGKGSVLAFPGASPFWLANAYLRRWGGQLLNQHEKAGYDFLLNIISYKETAPVGGKAPEFSEQPLLKQQDYSYRYLNNHEWDELKNLKPFRTWIGTITHPDELEASADKTRKQGYDVGIFISDYALLSTEKWRQLQVQCNSLSETGKFLALPAFEQADDEGNYCIVFNVDDLPELRASYPNSNMLEDLLVKLNSYSAVYARPADNRIPPWRHGGYNLLEIAEKEDLAVYHERLSSSTFLSAVHIDRGTSGFDNWLLAPSLEEAPAAIRENRHFNFVSSGPILKRFFWRSGPVMLDDWEGYWLEWEHGDTAKVEIELQADSPITEVKLWDGEEVIKTWQPDSKSFSTSVQFELEYDLRLHLTAIDSNGGELAASWPLYTRNRLFWAHTGSDQMNDYHNVWTPAPNGSIGIGDRIYETCGFVTLGFAWGDYLRIAPPVNWGDIMPQGVEVSSMVGNLQSFHPSPFAVTDNGFDFLNDHRRKLGKCTQDLHIVHSTASGSWLEQPEAEWLAPNGRTIKPTRNFSQSDLWQAESEYLIPRWKAGQPCEVTVNMRIKWLKDHTFAPGATISLGHSLNILKPDIGLKCGDKLISADDFLTDHAQSQHVANKEWDNAGLVELLAEPGGNLLEIPLNCNGGTNGDPMGDFLFRPVNVPGKVHMRGWRHNPGFVLSFELIPEQQEIKAGTIMDIQYILVVTPGYFTEDKETSS